MISILMPVRNAKPYIAQAIASVLEQDYDRLELVVVEDGSTDGSAEVVGAVRDSRVRMVTGPRNGVAQALNSGLQAARGELVARCDADDLYVAGRLRWQVDWLERQGDFVAVCAGFAVMTPGGRLVADLHSPLKRAGGGQHAANSRRQAPGMAGEITAELQAGTCRTSFCTWCVRSEAVRQIGGFRGWFRSAEDIDLQLRLGEAGRVWFEPKLSYMYRLHDESVTHTLGDATRVFYDQAARTFQRQRRERGTDDLESGDPPPVPMVGVERSGGGLAGEAAAGGVPHGTSADQIQQILIGRSWREHQGGFRMRSLATGLRACWARPRNPAAWKSLGALLIKRRQLSS